MPEQLTRFNFQPPAVVFSCPLPPLRPPASASGGVGGPCFRNFSARASDSTGVSSACSQRSCMRCLHHPPGDLQLEALCGIPPFSCLPHSTASLHQTAAGVPKISEQYLVNSTFFQLWLFHAPCHHHIGMTARGLRSGHFLPLSLSRGTHAAPQPLNPLFSAFFSSGISLNWVA